MLKRGSQPTIPGRGSIKTSRRDRGDDAGESDRDCVLAKAIKKKIWKKGGDIEMESLLTSKEKILKNLNTVGTFRNAGGRISGDT